MKGARLLVLGCALASAAGARAADPSGLDLTIEVLGREDRVDERIVNRIEVPGLPRDGLGRVVAAPLEAVGGTVEVLSGTVDNTLRGVGGAVQGVGGVVQGVGGVVQGVVEGVTAPLRPVLRYEEWKEQQRQTQQDRQRDAARDRSRAR